MWRSDNIRHLEECDGCHECDALLEFYMACDDCGSWGMTDSDGFVLVNVEVIGIQFYCMYCAEKLNQENAMKGGAE